MIAEGEQLGDPAAQGGCRGPSLHVQEGETVELTIKGDCIEIRAVRPHYRLEDLLAQITPGTQPETVEFAPADEEAL
jgi:hypothetical protein